MLENEENYLDSENFSKEFKKYKEEQNKELENGRVYSGIVKNIVKKYTSKMNTPMLTLVVEVSEGIPVPKQVEVNYVLDKHNEEYLSNVFNKLQKALETLNYDLEELGNLDDLVSDLKSLKDSRIYIKPYELKGFVKYNVVRENEF